MESQGIVSITVLIASVLIGALFIYKGLYKTIMSYWVQSKSNEWHIIIRNGNMVKKGIGLCCFIRPGDQSIKFASQLNQVSFKAQQVTAEMQGIEVTGMLIWSVYRQDDGPFKCYKSFGEDLQKDKPSIVNGKLENMAVSIIRDRIANLTINEILKNRQKLRNGVRDEMQKLLTGWGIWLETCEVLDVQISSKSLFMNLQTEFREASRQSAEKIAADTQNTIRQEELIRTSEFNKKKIENETRTKKIQAEQRLEEQKQQAIIYIEECKLQKTRQEADNQKKIRDAEMKNELRKKEMEFERQTEQADIELKIKQEVQLQNLKKAEIITQQISDQYQAEKRNGELGYMQNQLKVKEVGYTDNVLKSMILDSTVDIYKNLNISEMKVVNMGGQGNRDPAGQFIEQLMTSYKGISEGLK